MVTHASNPWTQEDCEFEGSVGYIQNLPQNQARYKCWYLLKNWDSEYSIGTVYLFICKMLERIQHDMQL